MKKKLRVRIYLLFIALILLQSCKSTSSSQRSQGEVGYAATDLAAARERDSVLVEKYSLSLGTSPELIRRSMPLYTFIDSCMDIPYSKTPGENSMDDVMLVRKIYEKVYQRKMPGSFDEMMSSRLIPKFSDKSYLSEGDLVFFRKRREYQPDIKVVGVYLHNHKFITCSRFTGGVSIHDLDDPYWKSRYKMAGRIK